MPDRAPRIRKQVYELTGQDFLDHAIWEFCSDEEGVEGQDEATVRPTAKTELTDELPGACVLAARVSFAHGSSGAGDLYTSESDDFGCVQPNLLAGASQVNFWLGWLRFIPNAAQRVQLGYRSSARPKMHSSQSPLNRL